MNPQLILLGAVFILSAPLVLPTPYEFDEGVKRCWASNKLCSTCSDSQWKCTPEKGLGPRRCVKFNFDGDKSRDGISLVTTVSVGVENGIHY